jgi:hypothetical protein
MQSRLTNKMGIKKVKKQDFVPVADHCNRNDTGPCSECYMQVEVLLQRNTNMLPCQRLVTSTVKSNCMTGLSWYYNFINYVYYLNMEVFFCLGFWQIGPSCKNTNEAIFTSKPS